MASNEKEFFARHAKCEIESIIRRIFSIYLYHNNETSIMSKKEETSKLLSACLDGV